MPDLQVLIVDDERRITDELSEYLIRQGYQVHCADGAGTAFPILKAQKIDILILDIRLPGMDGIEILKQVKRDYPATEVLMISGHGDMDTVIQALRQGAIDYLKKPFRQSEIKAAIERSSKYVSWQKNLSLSPKNDSLIPESLVRLIDKDFIGSSDAIKRILKDSLHFAGFRDTPVIITGESGTGKEIVARVIHFASNRKDARFVPINCSAIPENLLESEFFGYTKGAFTGAVQDKKGILELGQGGTVFLDEIGDMPPALQAKLLRVIEEKRYMRLGCPVESPIDIRFIAATNRNLEEDIAAGKFRADLYYRLATCTIHIPALRERSEDIEGLVQHFARSFCDSNGRAVPDIDPGMIEHLINYDFPGNVRELKNIVERAIITDRDGKLSMEDFPLIELSTAQDLSALDAALIQQIKKALAESNNNQSSAAKLLGISRYTLIRKIKKYDIS